jgi:hypothetical protein
VKRKLISIIVMLGLLVSMTVVPVQAATQTEIDQAIQDGLAWLAAN